MSRHTRNELSKRALIERILELVERTEHVVTAAADYIKQALDGLDVQMTDLQTRLQADAQALQDALAQSQVAAGDEQALTDAADRITATATAVSQLAPPSVVADPNQPDVTAGPVVDPTTDPTTDPNAAGPTGPTPTDPTTGGGGTATA